MKPLLAVVLSLTWGWCEGSKPSPVVQTPPPEIQSIEQQAFLIGRMYQLHQDSGKDVCPLYAMLVNNVHPRGWEPIDDYFIGDLRECASPNNEPTQAPPR